MGAVCIYLQPMLMCSTHDSTDTVERSPIFVANSEGRTNVIVVQNRITGQTGSMCVCSVDETKFEN